MSSMKELPKVYRPADYEDAVYAAWEKSGAFRPASDRDPKLKKRRKPYTIVMPPPNATGILHTGHAIMVAIEDAVVRYHRMKGFDTLYLPGTDHAAIATASVVDRELAEAGKTRHDIGRRAFERRAAALAKQNKQTIETQIRGLGASADWSRNAFTLDPPRRKAVTEAFKRLYRKGLIYRGSYMVNWCPACRTVLADDEVEHREQEGVLYHLKYGPFVLATTRPETKVGDTAVAVHPNDKRYKKYVGQTVDVQTINGLRKLKVIADEMVDPKFGTGVVKITPFHDPNDYQVMQRHDLEAIEVIGEDGRMTEAAGKALAGLDRFAARKKMVSWLTKHGLLVKEEVHRHSVGRCYRSDDVVEPRISQQWFLKVSELKKQALKFADTGELKFVPPRFEKTYRDWLEHLHDWCISRQVWFGHPIPAYLNDRGETSLTKKPGFKPSTDTLDTWFSSALWPFSTLGWPDRTPDLKRFFPGDVLESGYDIIFFWITRMVLMTSALEVTGREPEGRPPFHTAYLHGLVRDKRGRKFSKSLGNGVDPLELIGKYGADALRFMLATSSTPGGDVKFDEDRVVAARNFANKLWNISRFIVAQKTASAGDLPRANLTVADRWILERLRQTTSAVEDAFADQADYEKTEPEPAAPPSPGRLRPYDLAAAGNRLYEFIWSEFADWYLEVAKVQLANEEQAVATGLVLRHVLETALKLLHPLMPFITETIWRNGLARSEPLITSPWPQWAADLRFPEEAARFAEIKGVIETIRRIRSEHGTPAGATIRVYVISDEPEPLAEAEPLIRQLARVANLTLAAPPRSEEVATAVSGRVTVAVPLAGLVDREAEAQRLQGEVERTKMEVARLKARLNDKDYAAKAPPEIVSQTEDALHQAEERLRRLSA
jgi:valyl-tRNA synthetase